MNIAVLSAVNSTALTSGDFEYTVENGEATITKYNGSAQMLDIPSELDGYAVTAIESQAFYGNEDLCVVSIPDSVTRIADLAFYGNSQLSLIIFATDSVTNIDENAFVGNGASNFYVRLGSCAAQYAQDNGFYHVYISSSPEGFLYSIDTNDNTASVTGRIFSLSVSDIYSFYGYGSITSINVPSTVDGFNVVEIGDYAFRGLNWFTEITIPYGIKSIESYAFAGCGFEEFTIPDSVEIIWDYAFYGCENLKSITIPHSVKEIEYDAFFYCPSLERVKIEEGVEKLPTSASLFGECGALKSVIIPRSVKTFGSDIFGSGYNSLTDIFVYRDSTFDKSYKNKTAYKDKLRYFGDLNGDGNIDISDYTLVKSELEGTGEVFTEVQTTVADYNLDGAIDAFDLFEIDKTINS